MTQEVVVSTDKVESPPEATPEATPEVAEPTPEKTEEPSGDEAEATKETVEETVEETQPLDTILTGYEAEDSPHREAFQKFRQEEQAKGWAEARDSYSTEITKQTERTDGLTRLYEGATQSYKTLLGRLDKALSGGQVDRDALNEVFQDPNFTRATEAIGKQAQEGARTQGITEGRAIGERGAVEGIVTIGAKVLGRQSLAQEFIPKIQAAKTPEDGIAMVEGFIKKVDDIGYQRGLTDNKSGTAHVDALEKRKTEKPAQNVGTTTGGRTDRERKIDPLTPVSELREIRARERAG